MICARSTLALVFALLLVPPSASAATIEKAGSTITYGASAGEANDVSVLLAGDSYTFTEQGKSPAGGVGVTDLGGCQVSTQGTVTTATCPAAGVNVVVIDAGDQNDTVKVVSTTATRILGGDGNDNLSGGDGPDTLIGGAGADAIVGGNGTDVVDYSDRSKPLVITLDGQPGDGEEGELDNVAADIEIVNGGSGADSISGGDANNVLNGNGGNDTLNGQGGDDALNRGDRDAGRDAGVGDDVLIGGPGFDSASYEGAPVPVFVTIDGKPGDGAGNESDNVETDVENVTGGNRGDVLIGNKGSNVLQGGPGNDRLLGGGGKDTLDGEAGNDAIEARDGNTDQVLCSGGRDGVIADARDVLNGCEVVQHTIVAVLAKKEKLSRGVIRLPVRCSEYAADGCAGALTLQSGRSKLGSASFDFVNGRKASLRVKVSREGRRLLRKRHKLSASATITVTDSSGHVTKAKTKLKLSA